MRLETETASGNNESTSKRYMSIQFPWADYPKLKKILLEAISEIGELVEHSNPEPIAALTIDL